MLVLQICHTKATEQCNMPRFFYLFAWLLLTVALFAGVQSSLSPMCRVLQQSQEIKQLLYFFSLELNALMLSLQWFHAFILMPSQHFNIFLQSQVPLLCTRLAFMSEAIAEVLPSPNSVFSFVCSEFVDHFGYRGYMKSEERLMPSPESSSVVVPPQSFQVDHLYFLGSACLSQVPQGLCFPVGPTILWAVC